MSEASVYRGWTITQHPRHTIAGEAAGELWKGKCESWLSIYGYSLADIKAQIDGAIEDAENVVECEEDDHKYWLNSNDRP